MNEELIKDEEKKDDIISIEKEDFVDREGTEEAIMGAAFSKDEPAVPAKIFLDDDSRIKIEIDIFSDKKTGKIVNVFKKGMLKIDDVKNIFGYTSEEFEFSIPSFEDVTLYRQQSSNNINRTVDKSFFRNFLVSMHLKDWSLKDEKGNKINLDFDINGGLTQKSSRIVNRVPTVIWDLVLTIFERETLIS